MGKVRRLPVAYARSRPPKLPTAWYQIGGDVDARAYGITIARVTESSVGLQVEIVEVAPLDEGGYFVSRADIPDDDLDWADNRQAAATAGIRESEWRDMGPVTRAQARFEYWGAAHLGGDQRKVRLWRDALPVRLSSVKQFSKYPARR